MTRVFALLLAVSSPSIAMAQSRLVRSTTDDLSRVCIYERPRTAERVLTRVRPGQDVALTGTQVATRVGLAEPCPTTYRAPVTTVRSVPSLATLRGRNVQRGRTFCVYAYSGVDYPIEVRAGGSCPLTPVFVTSVARP